MGSIGRIRGLDNEETRDTLRELDRRRPLLDLGTVRDNSARPTAEVHPGRLVLTQGKFGVAAALYYSDGTAWRDVIAGETSFTTPAIALGAAAIAGTGSSVIAHNSTIQAFDGTNPADVGLAAVVGTAAVASHRDHVHKIGTGAPDGTKFLRDDLAWIAVVVPSGGAPNFTLGTSNAAGAAATHVLTDATIALFNDAGVPADLATAAADGTNAVASRNDHVHLFPTSLKSTANDFTLDLTDSGTRMLLLAGNADRFTINPPTSKHLFLCDTDDKLLRVGSASGSSKDKAHMQNTTAVQESSACKYVILDRNTQINWKMFAFKAQVTASNAGGEGIGIPTCIFALCHGVGNKPVFEQVGLEIEHDWSSSGSGGSSVAASGTGVIFRAMDNKSGAAKWTKTYGIRSEAQPNYVTTPLGGKFEDPVEIEGQAADTDRVAAHVLLLTQNSGGGAVGAHINMNDKGGDPATPATGNIWKSGTQLKIFDSMHINQGSVDTDTIIEGATDANLLHVDAGADAVGISTGTPDATLEVAGTFHATGNAELDGDLNHDGTNAGFYSTAPTTKPASSTDIVDGMLSLGLTTAGSAVGYYGGIHAYDAADTITITGSGIANKIQITTFDANDDALGTTPDHTNDHITITNAGIYYCSLSMHVESDISGGADLVGVGVFKNDGATLFENLHGHRKLAGGAVDTGSMTVTGIVTLAVDDTIEAWIWNEDSTDDLVVDDITLSLFRVGDNT